MNQRLVATKYRDLALSLSAAHPHSEGYRGEAHYCLYHRPKKQIERRRDWKLAAVAVD